MALFLLSCYISFYDIYRHKISHGSIAAVSLLLIFRGSQGLYFISGLIFLLLFLVAGLVGGLGGGDVKLLVVMALLGIRTEEIGTFLALLSCSTAILALITISIRRSARGNIALAPAICTSYLVLLLSR